MNIVTNISDDNPMFPEVRLNLNSPAGNAFVIMMNVSEALKRANYEKTLIDSILDDMKSSNYEHLCSIARKYITLYNTEEYEIENNDN